VPVTLALVLVMSQAFLLKLQQNLIILREREAKYGNNAPLELLNQIGDHQSHRPD
jgi:hypothetical protein